jgi:hypothetical protein
MLTAEEKELFHMVKAIYHHLGLDGARVISMRDREDRAERDILKWREKQRTKEYERATNQRRGVEG